MMLSFFLYFALLALFVERGAEAQISGEELASVFVDALLEYDVYPPITDDPLVWQDESIVRQDNASMKFFPCFI